MQQLSKLIFSSSREDRIIAGEIIYKNLDIFDLKEIIINIQYKIWTFEDLPDIGIDDITTLETGMLTPEKNNYTIYFSRGNKSIYYYPNTKTHV